MEIQKKKLKKLPFKFIIMETLKTNNKFWDSQPLIKDGIIIKEGAIEGWTDYNSNSLSLPRGFQWVSFNLKNIEDREEVVTFLNKYNLDDLDSFQPQLTSNYIEWSLLNDRYSQELSIGVKVSSNNLLVGFIGGKVVNTQLNSNSVDIINVKNLCVIPKLRGKRLTPILIKELTRRCNILGYKQGIFLTKHKLPSSPLVQTCFYNRALNVKNLVDCGFTKLSGNLNIKDVKNNLKLPNEPEKYFKKMELTHINECFDLLNRYFDKYNCHPIFTKEEFITILTNKIVTCYVLLNEYDEVLDFVSYYLLQYKKGEKVIRKAHLFFYTCMNETPYRLIKDLLIIARNNNIDVFCAQDIMEHSAILKDLNFEGSTSSFYYYLYNWQLRPIKNIQLAFLTY